MTKWSLILLCVAPLFGADLDCDRACLKATLDTYMKAVVEHNPAGAPLAIGYRETDNAVALRQGTGIWKSVTSPGKVQRKFLDPVNGQAAFLGTLEEAPGTAVVSVRIRVENRKISEAEWYIARKSDNGLGGPNAPNNVFDPENLAKTMVAERVVAKAQRLSRQDLLGITQSYFDGITSHDGSVILAHPGCLRVENGTTMTARPLQPNAIQANGSKTSDCTSGLEGINTSLVAARRYPVIDEEQGVVLALAVFQRKQGTTTRRNVFSEYFFIDEQKIRTIFSAMFYPPPQAPVPNWPPFDANWPMPPSFGDAK